MLTRTRLAALAVTAAAALVPALGAQAAHADGPNLRLERLELCAPKWMVLNTQSVFDQGGSGGGVGGFDVENQTSDGRDQYGYETVAVDDPTYSPC